MKQQRGKHGPAIPLRERVRLFMERLHQGVPLWPYNDAATISECLERGLIKRGRRRIHARWAVNVLIPFVPAPVHVIERVPQPYAKRIAAMEAATLKHRRATKAAALHDVGKPSTQKC